MGSAAAFTIAEATAIGHAAHAVMAMPVYFAMDISHGNGHAH